MTDPNDQQRVKELVDQIQNKTRDLGDAVKRRVLEKIIAACQERLDQLPHPDQGLPGAGQPPGPDQGLPPGSAQPGQPAQPDQGLPEEGTPTPKRR